jgi:hypothetical protein
VVSVERNAGIPVFVVWSNMLREVPEVGSLAFGDVRVNALMD